MSLIGSYLKFKVWQWREEKYIRSAYPFFSACDRAFKKRYRFANPYRISRQFLQSKRAPDVHLYGETPLTTLEEIGKQCGITPDDCFVDLGCGRGRGVFFMAHRFGCEAVGIEQIPLFIEKAQSLNVKRTSFSLGDYFTTDLSKASVIYLYGTCLTDDEVTRISARFQTLRSGTKIITVSYPLEGFSLLNTMTVQFPWGETEIYFQTKC